MEIKFKQIKLISLLVVIISLIEFGLILKVEGGDDESPIPQVSVSLTMENSEPCLVFTTNMEELQNFDFLGVCWKFKLYNSKGELIWGKPGEGHGWIPIWDLESENWIGKISPSIIASNPNDISWKMDGEFPLPPALLPLKFRNYPPAGTYTLTLTEAKVVYSYPGSASGWSNYTYATIVNPSITFNLKWYLDGIIVWRPWLGQEEREPPFQYIEKIDEVKCYFDTTPTICTTDRGGYVIAKIEKQIDAIPQYIKGKLLVNDEGSVRPIKANELESYGSISFYINFISEAEGKKNIDYMHYFGQDTVPGYGHVDLLIPTRYEIFHSLNWSLGEAIVNSSGSFEWFLFNHSYYQGTGTLELEPFTFLKSGYAAGPEASFTMSPENPTTNDVITFTSNSTGDIVEYDWFLDGDSVNESTSTWTWYNPSVGNHTVELTVIDANGYTDTAQLTFDVQEQAPSELSLTASTDKPTYITRETMMVKGKISYGTKDMSIAWIDLKIHFPNGTTATWPGGHPNSDGSFAIPYEIPIIPFNVIPPKPQDWDVEVIASYQEYGKSPITASTTLKVKVLPIWLKIHGMHLVQVVELPHTSAFPTLAAGKEAGIRVMVSCPGLKETEGASKPKVKVKFSIDIQDTELIKKEKEIEIGADPTPVDFIFTLPEGFYTASVLVDSDHKYMDIKYLDEMLKVESFNVKKMKGLKIEFAPLYINLNGEEAKANWAKFCREQSNFIKSVYPLPDSNLKFVRVTETKNPVLLLPGLAAKRWLLLKALSIRSYLTAEKVVGVLPDSPDWWGAGESGYSSWSVYPLFYYTRSVLVKYGANEGVTAHEIGHTLGLNRGPSNEEYNLHPYFGNEVKCLILKNGKIYNISKEDDKQKAFGRGTSRVFCFMGNNPGWPQPSWVCQETYADLFKYLKDPPSEKVVYVAGVIYKNGTIQLDNWYLGDGEPDSINGGNYTIQCVSSTGEILYSGNFGCEPDNFMAFGFVIPYPDGTYKISIKKGDEVLKEVRRTPNSPTVTIQYPSGGEILDGKCEIKWRGEDLDGDELSYSILYSNDGGKTWIAPAVNLNETSYTLNFSNLPGGDTCLIKVVATDGFNTGYAVSGNFMVENKNPVAVIISPKNGERFNSSTKITFEGYGYDIEDYELQNTSLTWISSIDGVIGTGEHFSTSHLSPGKHEITLTVLDSTEKSSQTSITIYVGKNKESTPGFEIMLLIGAIAIALAMRRRREI